MRSHHLLYSAAQFVFALLVLLIGILFVGMQYAPHVRFAVANFICRSEGHFSLVGYLILGCGILLLVGFYFMHRGVYYQIKMGKKKTSIDSNVIRDHVKIYWEEIFPGQNLQIQVDLSCSQKIKLFVELPLLTEDVQLKTLQKAERDLQEIFKRQLRYEKDFRLSVMINPLQLMNTHSFNDNSS